MAPKWRLTLSYLFVSCVIAQCLVLMDIVNGILSCLLNVSIPTIQSLMLYVGSVSPLPSYRLWARRLLPSRSRYDSHQNFCGTSVTHKTSLHTNPGFMIQVHDFPKLWHSCMLCEPRCNHSRRVPTRRINVRAGNLETEKLHISCEI